MMNASREGEPGSKALVLVFLLAVVLAAGVLVLAGARPAEAAFPGKNVFTSDRTTTGNPEGDDEIFTMNPDGSSLKQLTDNDADDRSPSWSANGERNEFERDRAQARPSLARRAEARPDEPEKSLI